MIAVVSIYSINKVKSYKIQNAQLNDKIREFEENGVVKQTQTHTGDESLEKSEKVVNLLPDAANDENLDDSILQNTSINKKREHLLSTKFEWFNEFDDEIEKTDDEPIAFASDALEETINIIEPTKIEIEKSKPNNEEKVDKTAIEPSKLMNISKGKFKQFKCRVCNYKYTIEQPDLDVKYWCPQCQVLMNWEIICPDCREIINILPFQVSKMKMNGVYCQKCDDKFEI